MITMSLRPEGQSVFWSLLCAVASRSPQLYGGDICDCGCYAGAHTEETLCY